MELAGGVFIVTGSATGLGAEVSRRLAGKGGNVVINYTKSVAEARETARRARISARTPYSAKRTLRWTRTAGGWRRRRWNGGAGSTGW